jgi:hypothetical protein
MPSRPGHDQHLRAEQPRGLGNESERAGDDDQQQRGQGLGRPGGQEALGLLALGALIALRARRVLLARQDLAQVDRHRDEQQAGQGRGGGEHGGEERRPGGRVVGPEQAGRLHGPGR